MEEKMKSELIDRFKAARKKASFIEMYEHRIELAVKHQFNRDMWELYDVNGIIRIEDGNSPRIVVFNTIQYCADSGQEGTYEAEISKWEFSDLKKIYFGTHEPDYDYLKKHYNK